MHIYIGLVCLFSCIQLVSIQGTCSASHSFGVPSLWPLSFMSFRISVRSPQWLRSKWWALKKHVPESDTTTFQGMFSPSLCWYQMSTFDGTFTVQWNVQHGHQCTTKSSCIWGLTLREKKWETSWSHSCVWIKSSGFKPRLRTLCFVLGQDT